MKKYYTGLIAVLVVLAICFTACSAPADDTGGTGSAPNSKQTMTISEFESLLSTQPLSISRTKYVVQDEQYKSLYPDMLQAILQNNTTEDIKNVVIAFAAWDNNNLPVKIEGQFDFSGGSYVKEVNFSDINLAAGNSFGDKNGFSLSESCQISSFKAIVVSFETFSGQTWKNPYYDNFRSLYEGKKYADDLTIDVKIVDSTFAASENTAISSADKEDDASMSASELEANLSKQPISIVKANYIVQDEQYKSLYPDMLQVILQNNSNEDIKNAVVAFVAWDANNLPVKIEGQFDFNGGSYVKEVIFSAINLAVGGTAGESEGYSLAENLGIKSFKAIVVSYETFNGEIWENPYYADFCTLYEEQKLTNINQ